MKTKQLFLFIFIFPFLYPDVISAETQERNLPPFSEISLRISGTVYLEQGNRQSVRIDASDSAMDEIITEVKDRTLVIRFKSGNYFRRSFNPGKIAVYVTVPEINALSVAGSGNIESSSVKSRILNLAVSGSGDISLDHLTSERLMSAVSGSGNIHLSNGNANELSTNISGSGNLKAMDFEATNADIRISGSGNCTITAQKSLKARVSGSGSVSYKGTPQLDTSVSGSGRIKKL